MQLTTTRCEEGVAGKDHQLIFSWQQQRLQVTANQPPGVAENEDYLIVTLGDIREYQQELSPFNDSAAQLLAVIGQSVNDFYHKIAGFFAAIIIDKHRDKLYLITDHVGSIPLYYHFDCDGLTVTNSLSLLAPRQFELNPQGIFNYCYFHCIPAPTTIYRDVYKVEAGHQVSFNEQGYIGSTLLYRPHYDYSTESDEKLYQQCQRLVAGAVKRHVSPDCGAFLSGGLDSSTVAGMLARQQRDAKTFSIGFEVKSYDETEYALITARHFATQHRVHQLEPEALINNFEKIAGYFDEPFGNSSAMAAYACAEFAKSHGVNQMLAGDGGDEIFAGNERYAQQRVFEYFVRCPSWLQTTLSGLFCQTPLQHLPFGAKAASYIRQAKMGLPDRLESYNFINRFELTDIFSAEFLAKVDAEQPLMQKRQRYQQADSCCMIEQMLFLDWKFTLADNDLVKVSKMCEMVGVKVRFPLLEKELVDFSCTLSADQKLPKQQLRDFYKKAFADFLAPETLSKSKHGFGLPFGEWMKQSDELMTMARMALERLSQRNIINGQFIEQAVAMHHNDHCGYYGELIWILVVLELWLEAHHH